MRKGEKVAVRLVKRRWSLAVTCVVVYACFLAVAGCGDGGASPDLEGTTWVLSGWSEGGLDPTDFTITASFADGAVSGQSAVNSYSASFATGPEDAFSTGDIASTTMAGPEDAMRAEKSYFELLVSAASYGVSADTLRLFDEFGDEALVFETARE